MHCNTTIIGYALRLTCVRPIVFNLTLCALAIGWAPYDRLIWPDEQTNVCVITNFCMRYTSGRNNGHVSALCLLDLAAAFDTVDHDLLTLRLERQFGLRGIVLQWFRSYLSDRSYRPQDIINDLHRVLGTTGFGT